MKKTHILKTYCGVEQSGQLAWLITTRSQVQILPPQPKNHADVAESVDAPASGAGGQLVMEVQVLSSAPIYKKSKNNAGVAESVDALDLNPGAIGVRVRVPPPAPNIHSKIHHADVAELADAPDLGVRHCAYCNDAGMCPVIQKGMYVNQRLREWIYLPLPIPNGET